MMCFQMILSCLNLVGCQIFLEEVMIVVSVTHDKSLLILTDDTISIKTMIMVFIMMVSMMIFIVIVIMSWTWCCWCFTSQMILCRLDLFRGQIFLKEIMIVVAMGHDKALRIFTDNSIGIKTVIMVFIMMVSMMIFIVIVIMSWIWCCCICPFQVVLRCLDLISSQILLEEVMIVVTMTHDKSCFIFSNNTIDIKAVSTFFMFLM